MLSGNALTDFFFRDVGITQNQFNVGQQLMSLGIVLLEVGGSLVHTTMILIGNRFQAIMSYTELDLRFGSVVKSLHGTTSHRPSEGER